MPPQSTTLTVVITTAAATAAITASLFFLWNRRAKSTDESPPDLDGIIPEHVLQSSKYAKHVQCAIEMAWKAGQNMIPYCEAQGSSASALPLTFKSGGDTDFCTQIDVDNEQMIINGLLAEFPSSEILGEESVGTGDIPKLSSNKSTWIIDPIDGTTNFASGLPMTCVSIALYEPDDHHVVLGVIYAPMTKEWYVAIQGHGSYRNGVKLETKSSSTTLSLDSAIICCEFGYPRDEASVDLILKPLRRLLTKGHCRAIRQLGSGCLDLCYVASGRLDVVYAGLAKNDGWKPWDYAAGYVIVTEAGGVMESIDPKEQSGNKFDLYSTSVICAVNKKLLEECRELITKE